VVGVGRLVSTKTMVIFRVKLLIYQRVIDTESMFDENVNPVLVPDYEAYHKKK
jgi:hypothetical protein